MISLSDVLALHDQLIEKFGGSAGVRSLPLLEAAIKRPWQTFDKIELYPDITDKAAAIIESIVINHPFIDGNKRMGYVLMRLLLMGGGTDIQASEEDKYQFVISIASGHSKFAEIKMWIETHLRSA